MKRPVKVFRSGSNGLVVMLPADWVRGLGLLPGTVLEMEYSDVAVTVRRPLPPPPAISPVLKLLKKTQL